MRTNIFLRSTHRQPVRAAFLLLATALVTFAFVSRGVEYLLIKQETVRLEGYYHSTGTLTASSGVLYKDARGAAAYLESNPLVESVNIYNYVSGVIQEDIQSANTGSHYGEASRNSSTFLQMR